MNAKENIKNNLRFLAKSAGFTRARFAEELGIGGKALGAYMEGRTLPPMGVLLKVTDTFNISLDELVRLQLADYYHFNSQKIITKIAK